MKRILASLCILLVVLSSLSACNSTAITNKRLETDILSLDELSLVTRVEDLSIIEKTQNTSKTSFKISASLNAANFTATADITLEYAKTNDQWVLSSNSVEFIRVVPKNDPTMIAAVSQVVMAISNKILDPTFIGATSQRFKLDSMNSDKENGIATMVISENFDDGIFSMDAKYTVSAKYDRSLGWTYSIQDWISHEKTKWAGTYDIHWTQNDPGYPGGGLNNFYILGIDVNDITISGDATITKQMNKNELFNSSVNVSFTYEGIQLSAPGEFDSVEEFAAQTFYFNFRPNDNLDSYLRFMYFPLISNNPYGYENHLAIETSFIFGDLIKQP